mgnify:CR=1 FL=1
MAKGNNGTLTAEQEMQLRQPIEDYVGEIQKKIDSLREDGTNRVVTLQNSIDATKRDRSLTKEERENRIAANSAEMEKAKAVEAKNKDEIAKLISNAESYLKAHFDKDYYLPLKESCEREKALAKERYDIKVAELNKEHENTLSKLTDHQEIKDEKYVHKNRLFDAKMDLDKELQRIKDRRHAAFVWQYHLIDMLRLSKFTFMETRAQKWENYKYTFNRRTFLLQNGLYIAIILIFIGLCIAAPVIKNVQLLTYNNVLNILQQASPRMFLALGVAGLILLTGTDLSIGRMVGMGMTTATIIMHQGINTGAVFGHVFDFTGMPIGLRVVFALVMCIILCTCFTAIGGFFTAKFKMHPFISTMANMLVIFGLVTYATKGVSFGAIEPAIPKMIIPKNKRVPNHYPVGSGCHRNRLVYLEQDHLRQEFIRSRRQPGSSSCFRYLRIRSNHGSIHSGRYPLRIRFLAGMRKNGRFRLRRLRPGLGDGCNRSLRGRRRILYRRYR